MNNGITAIIETSAELRALMVEQQNPRLLQRLQMLYLLATRQARNRTEVARLLGVHRETVGAWLQLYQDKQLAGLLQLGQAPGADSSLPAEAIEGMRQKLATPQGVASYKELRRWVETTYELSTSYRVVYYTATEVLGARLAVARRSHIKKKRATKRPFGKH